jgi:S-phase kinase-associated protein 1
MTSNTNVNLVSSDGVTFSVSIKVAKLSQLVNIMTGGMDDDEMDDDEMEDIPILRVRSQVLSMIVDFMNHYDIDPMETIEKPLVSNNIGDVVQHWYAVFIERLDEDVLYSLVNAANYMHIQPLLELTCAGVALLINGKTPAEVNDVFHLQVDV